MIAGDKGNIVLTREEVGALIAALNYTKRRTIGVSWEAIDESLIKRLKEMYRNYNEPY